MRKVRIKPKFENFKEAIDYYFENRKTEYEMKKGSGVLSPHNNILHLQGLTKDLHKYEDGAYRVQIDEETIKKFHPNNINNKEFWTYAKKKFPKFSVCGGKSKSIKHCNERNILMAEHAGVLGFVKQLIKESPVKLNLFEIGYGHGNVFFELKDKVNYLGIDYYKIKKLNKYKNLLTIDKSGIPDMVQNNSYDIVYCVNVLQHCSQHDRFEYYQQAYDKLKTGGFFVGSCFLQFQENEDKSVWGIEDTNGRRYCNFFHQLTEVDTLKEFKEKYESIGFKFIDRNVMGINSFFFVLQK